MNFTPSQRNRRIARETLRAHKTAVQKRRGTPPLKLGWFYSSPIHAATIDSAREILSRTYKPDRWRLIYVRRVASRTAGYHYGHYFQVTPV